MRCLYCGNELALLKKLTGGGEFCSEAHRQKYQEEYNRLALSRLLQAQPAATERPPLDTVRSRTAKPVAEAPLPPETNPAPVAAPVPTPAAAGPAPSATPYTSNIRNGEPPVPPAVGFLLPKFQPALATSEFRLSEPLMAPIGAFLPDLTLQTATLEVPPAETVLLPILQNGWSMQGSTVLDRQVDARDLSRSSNTICIPDDHLRAVSPMADSPFALPAPALVGTFFTLPVAISIFYGSTLAAAAAPRTEVKAPVVFEESVTTLVEPLTELRPEVEFERLPQFPDPPPAAEGQGDIDIQDEVDNQPEPEAQAQALPEALPAPEPEPAPVVEAAPVPLAKPDPIVVNLETIKAEPLAFVAEKALMPSRPAVLDIEKPAAAAPEPEPEPEIVIPPAPKPSGMEVFIDLSFFGDSDPEPEPVPAVEPVPEPVAIEVLEPREPEVQEEPAPVVETAAAEPEPLPTPDPEPEPVAAAPAVEAAPQPESLTVEAAVEPAAESAPEPIAVPTVAESVLPNLTEHYKHVEILPVFPSDTIRKPAIPAMAPPVFRVTAPPIEALPLRSKMIYGSRPEKTASNPNPVPAATLPEPAAPAFKLAEPAPAAAAEAAPVEPKPAAVPTPAPAAPPAETIKDSPKLKTAPFEPRAAELPSKPSALPNASSLNLDDVRIGLETDRGSGWSRMGAGKKVAVGVGFAAALVIAGLLIHSSFASKPPVTPAAPPKIEAVGGSLITATGTWASDWANSGLRAPQVSLYRPSTVLSDYRIQFQGQIEGKTLGWVFRAVNPKNYYVTRLEITKPGLQPTVNVVHYGVINGEETQMTSTPLPFPVHLDTVYKVRTDVYGPQFKTFIQDTLVDAWSDDRLKNGGFGLVTERGDRSQVRSIQLFELKASN